MICCCWFLKDLLGEDWRKLFLGFTKSPCFLPCSIFHTKTKFISSVKEINEDKFRLKLFFIPEMQVIIITHCCFGCLRNFEDLYWTSYSTLFSGFRQDRMVQQKRGIIKIKFRSIWGMLKALATSRNLEISIWSTIPWKPCVSAPKWCIIIFTTSLHCGLIYILSLPKVNLIFSIQKFEGVKAAVHHLYHFFHHNNDI